MCSLVSCVSNPSVILFLDCSRDSLPRRPVSTPLFCSRICEYLRLQEVEKAWLREHFVQLRLTPAISKQGVRLFYANVQWWKVVAVRIVPKLRRGPGLDDLRWFWLGLLNFTAANWTTGSYFLYSCLVIFYIHRPAMALRTTRGPHAVMFIFFIKRKTWAMTVYASRFKFCRFFRAPCVEKKEPHRELKSSGSQQTVCKVYIYFTLYYASADVSSDLIWALRAKQNRNSWAAMSKWP